MALEEFCAKQTSEIMQLNRLVNFFLSINDHLTVFFSMLLLMTVSHAICRCNSTSMRGNAMP